MKTDKYGIEIKVGDYVLLDSYTGMEYGTSAGKIVQIKKIGSRRISFDAGYKNLRSAQFEFITAYTLVGYEKWREHNNQIQYKPLFVRTATNDEVYNSNISKLKKGTNDELTKTLIKNEDYKYQEIISHYKLRNSGYAFSLDVGRYKYLRDNLTLPIIE